jgi:hypothetical protein
VYLEAPSIAMKGPLRILHVQILEIKLNTYFYLEHCFESQNIQNFEDALHP